MDAILEVVDLVKDYPRLRAVDRISFAIPPGICFGLLGPNGAGKTTTIEIIEGITKKTSGVIRYKGVENNPDFTEKAGVQFQNTALLAQLTVEETLKTFGNLYKNPMDLDRLVSLCRLKDILSAKNDRISGGQKQRLFLAMALVNDPELLFLDEPTTGLDPQARRMVWDIIRDVKAQRRTVILTTHYMEEAQLLCDDIAIMDRGHIIARGSPENLLSENFRSVMVILPKKNFSGPPEDLLEGEPEGLHRLAETAGQYAFRTRDSERLLRLLLDRDVLLTGLTVRPNTLEDLFLMLTKETDD